MITLSNQTRHCKICFEEIKDYSLYNFISNKNNICEKCFSKFKPKFIHFNIGAIPGLSIYEYDQNIKDLLFKFKGCYDIELKDVFFPRYLSYLKIRYWGYVIVPLPSFEMDDKKRGFNHVYEIYSRLEKPIYNIIKKTKNVKQANLKRKDRLAAIKHFEITDSKILKDKKVLIVDDVYTTGSSVNAAITLIKQGKPKKIAVLVIAKNMLK